MRADPVAHASTSRRFRVVIAAVMVVVGLLIFWPAMHGQWMWDDTLDVVQNPLLRHRAGLWQIWFHPAGLYDYYPLKYSLQWLQWHRWQANPAGYHATNVALHLTSALLVWRILARLGVRPAWLGGLLFLIHPLVVESVAWISEVKNTLSLPLFLLSFDRFIRYDEARRPRDYGLSLALFLAAMLGKTSVVMLPLALLLYVWWKRDRIVPRDVLAVLPFAVVSCALGFVTWWFQQNVAIGAAEAGFNPVGGPLARAACAGTTAAFYLSKAVFPINLMPIYPQWVVDPPSVWEFLPWVAFAALGWWCWQRRDRWGRHALFGLGWFGIFAAPILGFVTISSQRFTWAMDHLIYVPLLGLIGLATAGVGYTLDRVEPATRRWGWVGVLAVCTTLTVASRNHAAVFRSEESLWADNARRNPAAWMAWFNLGKIHQESNRHGEALDDYRRALALHPNYADVYYNLGNLLRDTGKPQEAIEAYRTALRLRPNLVLARGNLAVALAQSGRLDEAITECQLAVAQNPAYADGQYNLGSLLVSTGRANEAIPHFLAVLRLDPTHPGAEDNLGIAYSNANQPAAAIPHFQRAIAQDPRSAKAHNNLGSALRQLGRTDAAIAEFGAALQLQPDYVNAAYNLGCAEAIAGKYADAIVTLERVVRLQPDHVDARVNLAAVLAAVGRKAEAGVQYDSARKLRPSLPVVAF